jgi:hypothetical protein
MRILCAQTALTTNVNLPATPRTQTTTDMCARTAHLDAVCTHHTPIPGAYHAPSSNTARNRTPPPKNKPACNPPQANQHRCARSYSTTEYNVRSPRTQITATPSKNTHLLATPDMTARIPGAHHAPSSNTAATPRATARPHHESKPACNLTATNEQGREDFALVQANPERKKN